MAALALGTPVVTTKGPLTEPVWNDRQAVALSDVGDHDGMVEVTERLLADAEKRRQLAARGRELYADRFDISHTLAALRASSRGVALEGQTAQSPAFRKDEICV